MIYLFYLPLIIAVLYLLVLFVNARWEAKTSPRVPMFTCDKHGPVPESVLMHLEGATEKPIPYCPFCMHEKAKQIKEQGLPKVRPY
jgi:hypothetical protein